MADVTFNQLASPKVSAVQWWTEWRRRIPRMGDVRALVAEITVEPVFFLAAVAMIMQGVVIQQLVADRSCRVTFNKSEEYCANVTDVKLSNSLKMLEANYNLYTRIIGIGPYIFISMLLGAFLDRHGPKLMILLPLFGDLIACVILATVSYVTWMGPEITLVAHAVKGLSGSHMTFYLGVDNYIIINSSTGSRTVRLAMLEAGFLAGMPLGYLLGSQLFGTSRNYTLVFLVSLFFYVLTIIYLLLRLRHEPFLRSAVPQTSRPPLISLANVWEGLNVICRPRPGRNRTYVILSVISARILLLPLTGGFAIFYPFTQLKFHFTVRDASNFDAYSSAIHFLGTVTVVPLISYVLKVSDVVFGLATICMASASHLTMAFSQTWHGLYVASVLQIGFTGCYVVCRSMMSKCVAQDEQGKLNAFFGLLGAVIPIFSGLVYTELFHATLTTFPEASFILSAVLTIMPAGVLTWMYFDMKKNNEKIIDVGGDGLKLLDMTDDSAEEDYRELHTMVENERVQLDKYDPQNEPWQRSQLPLTKSAQ